MPVFNAFEATNPRLKKNKTFNEGTTPGAARVSSGGKGREELKAVGERHGWTAREISMREIQQQMSADEVLWHEVFNKKNFDRAFERDAIAKHNRQAMSVWDIRKKWREGVSNEESRRAQEAGAEFARRFPTFDQTIDNAHAIVEFMEEHDLDATEITSYITAFRELTEQGKLTVTPAQSADDFYKTHPELHDRRTPPLIQARNAKAEQTAKHFHAAANATAKGTVVNVVDYPNEQSGHPAPPTKYSFRRLLDSLSAEEYQKRLNQDAVFAAAVDKFQNCNK